MAHLLGAEQLRVEYPTRVVLDGVTVGVGDGDRIGVVGRNGDGKSTLLRILAGKQEPDGGRVTRRGGVTLGMLDQADHLQTGLTVIETVVGDRPEYEWAGDRNVRDVLAGLIFDIPGHTLVDDLSGGQRRRVALAALLSREWDIVVLDEPTNHLDIESIIWLEGYLQSFDGALIITSHDKALLNRLVTRIVDLDGGELISYSGDYDFYLAQRELANTQREAQAARQQAMLAKEKAFIARFQARASHAAQVQSRVKKLEKIDVIEPPRRRHVPDFSFRQPPRSGDEVVRLHHVAKAYGRRVLYEDLTLTVRRQERWCLMGINGAGKSTLLKLIVGQASPDAGEVVLGANVRLGYFAQHTMEVLQPERSVIGTVEAEFPQTNIGTLRNLLAAFGFHGDDIEKPCRVLSGGERARLVLATMLFDPPNFLVLDEPTNHLDMETKAMLTRALAAFEGTMLLVSHDRDFLAATTNRVIEVDGGQTALFGCGYSEYVTTTGREAPGLPGVGR